LARFLQYVCKQPKMKNIILLLSVFAAATTFGKVQTNVNVKIVGRQFNIVSQTFASHDAEGTDKASIDGKIGDYIIFSENGDVYTKFDNKVDTMHYKLVGTDSLSFGDTPFKIEIKDDISVVLYQNEEETNGDYNAVWYNLEFSNKLDVSLN